MCVYLRAKFEVSGIIFFNPPHTSKRTPKKPTKIRVKKLKTFGDEIKQKVKYFYTVLKYLSIPLI